MPANGGYGANDAQKVSPTREKFVCPGVPAFGADSCAFGLLVMTAVQGVAAFSSARSLGFGCAAAGPERATTNTPVRMEMKVRFIAVSFIAVSFMCGLRLKSPASRRTASLAVVRSSPASSRVVSPSLYRTFTSRSTAHKPQSTFVVPRCDRSGLPSHAADRRAQQEAPCRDPCTPHSLTGQARAVANTADASSLRTLTSGIPGSPKASEIRGGPRT